MPGWSGVFSYDGQQAAVQDNDLFAQRPPDDEQRFHQSAKSGKFSTSSWMRASNLTFPTIPTLRPKLRKVLRRSFSIAIKRDAEAEAQAARGFWPVCF